MTERIPDKRYFKIGEAARIVGVETHVLRFWESEFPQVRPDRTPKNQRLYRKKDVETFQVVKRLLYEEGYTIPGARNMLSARQIPPETPIEKENELLKEIRQGLLEIWEMLEPGE